ncbi:MAG TPA: TolC family protein [Candidatus Binataceae bacterium]|nr:TolC family protein [Candidatus Binataceae bacterium]
MILLLAVSPCAAQSAAPSASVSGGSGPIAASSAGANTYGSVNPLLAAQPVLSPPPPRTSVSHARRRTFEQRGGGPATLRRQWSQDEKLPADLQPGQAYVSRQDNSAASLTLKEAVYFALRKNPAMRADLLSPLASLESVREANGAFDPSLNATLKDTKGVTPVSSILSTGGSPLFEQKQYDWNFGISKLLATTNGALTVTFDNTHLQSNSLYWPVNPSYNPSLQISLVQPLLRNFGLRFATIGVRVAEAGQRQAQFNLEQQLSDFVLQVTTDYWNVVLARANLRVARGALALAQDLVRQDLFSNGRGLTPMIAVKEAQSQAAAAEAGVSAAENAVGATSAVLRQDVMLDSSVSMLAQRVEPSEQPTGVVAISNDEDSLELAIENRPELSALREAVRAMLLQLRYAKNQTLPQLNFSAGAGINSTAGDLNCVHSSIVAPNCNTASGQSGIASPFSGVYNNALNRLWGLQAYNYAVGLNFQMPLDNDYANAALAQARIQYQQQVLQYRAQLSSIVAAVEAALSGVRTSAARVTETTAAVSFARYALTADEARYRTGFADTHELLQYQQEFIAAMSSQVQAQVDLEIAKLTLAHAQGTLLESFQIDFKVANPHHTPWYAQF